MFFDEEAGSLRLTSRGDRYRFSTDCGTTWSRWCDWLLEPIWVLEIEISPTER